MGGSLPLGIEAANGFQFLQSYLSDGDRLFLYTDGAHEVFDKDDCQLGRKGLEDFLVNTMRMRIEDQVDAVVESVRAFQHKSDFEDDVTVLCAHRR